VPDARCRLPDVCGSSRTAQLQVKDAGGFLSYQVIDHLPYRIVGFEVYTQFTSGGYENLGCGVGAEVKSPKDLEIRRVCRLPRDEKAGKPVSYATRLVRVEFENGLTWSPVGPSTKRKH
jgi:hypothetical protein